MIEIRVSKSFNIQEIEQISQLQAGTAQKHLKTKINKNNVQRKLIISMDSNQSLIGTIKPLISRLRHIV